MKKYLEPDFTFSAVITIDTQCDTLDGQPLEITGTSAALPQIRTVLDAFRQREVPIIHIVRIYQQDGNNVDLCRREAVEKGAEILQEGSPGCEPAEAMFPDKVKLNSSLLLSGKVQKINHHEVIIYKPRWGAFYQTPLADYLRSKGVNTLIFMGCNFPNCPRTSIYEASERDFKIVLVEDAISGLYAKGIEEMLNIGVKRMSAEEVKKAILKVSKTAQGVAML